MSDDVEELKRRLEERIGPMIDFPCSPNYRSKEKYAPQIFVCRNHSVRTLWECFSYPLGTRKNLAKICLEFNRELEGIFNPDESYAVSICTRTYIRYNQAR